MHLRESNSNGNPGKQSTGQICNNRFAKDTRNLLTISELLRKDWASSLQVPRTHRIFRYDSEGAHDKQQKKLLLGEVLAAIQAGKLRSGVLSKESFMCPGFHWNSSVKPRCSQSRLSIRLGFPTSRGASVVRTFYWSWRAFQMALRRGEEQNPAYNYFMDAWTFCILENFASRGWFSTFSLIFLRVASLWWLFTGSWRTCFTRACVWDFSAAGWAVKHGCLWQRNPCGRVKQGRVVILRFPLFYSIWRPSKIPKYSEKQHERCHCHTPFYVPHMLLKTRTWEQCPHCECTLSPCCYLEGRSLMAMPLASPSPACSDPA